MTMSFSRMGILQKEDDSDLCCLSLLHWLRAAIPLKWIKLNGWEIPAIYRRMYSHPIRLKNMNDRAFLKGLNIKSFLGAEVPYTVKVEILARDLFNVFPTRAWEREKMLVCVDGVNFKNGVEVPLHQNNPHEWSHECTYDHWRLYWWWNDNYLRFSWYDNSDRKLSKLGNFLQIVIFANYFAALMFPTAEFAARHGNTVVVNYYCSEVGFGAAAFSRRHADNSVPDTQNNHPAHDEVRSCLLLHMSYLHSELIYLDCDAVPLWSRAYYCMM